MYTYGYSTEAKGEAPDEKGSVGESASGGGRGEEATVDVSQTTENGGAPAGVGASGEGGEFVSATRGPGKPQPISDCVQALD